MHIPYKITKQSSDFEINLKLLDNWNSGINKEDAFKAYENL